MAPIRPLAWDPPYATGVALKKTPQNLFSYLFLFVFLPFSWAAPTAYGGSQARGLIGAAATGLRQSHSNAGSEPRLQPTPQLADR